MPLSSGFTSGDLLNYAVRLRRRPGIAYSVLIGALVAATLARYLLGAEAVIGPFVTYYPVIIIAALLGGFWTGVISVACSAILGWYVIVFAASPLMPDSLNGASLLVFVTLACLDVAIAAVVNKAIIRLTEQEKNIRSLVEALPNAVMVINTEGVINNVNAGAERIFGYPRSELIGATTSILVPERLRRRHDAGMAAYLVNPKPFGLGPDRQFKGKRKDGSEISVEVGLTPIERHGKVAVVATVFDISERIRAEERGRLLSRELQHRTQNLFSVIQAIVARTMTTSDSLEEAKHELKGRINALASAHSVTIEGDSAGISLAHIIQRELGEIASGAVTVTGCDVTVNASAAQQFALIIHELATNAFKYGALSRPRGWVSISGLTTETTQGKVFGLTWTERGGPTVMSATSKGFGHSILFEAAKQFGMAVTADFQSEGLVYSLLVAFEDIEPESASLVPPEVQAKSITVGLGISTPELLSE